MLSVISSTAGVAVYYWFLIVLIFHQHPPMLKLVLCCLVNLYLIFQPLVQIAPMGYQTVNLNLEKWQNPANEFEFNSAPPHCEPQRTTVQHGCVEIKSRNIQNFLFKQLLDNGKKAFVLILTPMLSDVLIFGSVVAICE